MTSTPIAGQKDTSARRTAALYLCVERAGLPSAPALVRAEKEGQHYARNRGLTIAEVISDEHGTPDPRHRKGWQRVRELAASGSIGLVITPWPACISPEPQHELRYREIRWLLDHGVRVGYSWQPLAEPQGEFK